MHNLEMLAIVPRASPRSDNLHQLAHAVPLQDARKLVGIFCHWHGRGLEGLWFLLHLSLMFSFLCTGAHDDRKAITVPQGLPDGID